MHKASRDESQGSKTYFVHVAGRTNSMQLRACSPQDQSEMSENNNHRAPFPRNLTSKQQHSYQSISAAKESTVQLLHESGTKLIN